jgi:O-antigen ligase
MAGRVEPRTGFFFVLKYFEYFIVFFMVANHVENDKQLKRILFCLFLTCFITTFIGMAQIPAGGRVSAPFEGEQGEPNTFGGYLVLVGSVAAGIVTTVKDKRTRWMLALLILAIIPPLLFTRSRSSYLAALPAFFLIGWFSEKRRFVLPLMLIGLIVSPLFLPQAAKERILYTFSQPFHEQQIQVGDVRLDTSLSARIKSWQDALKDFPEHPFIGYGITGYAFLDAQYFRVLLESGILGLAAFGYLLYAVFRLIRSTWEQVENPLYRGLLKGFAAAYVGMLFHAIGANTFIIVRIMEPFWFVAGLVTVLPAIEAKRDGAVAETPATSEKRLSFRGLRGRPLRDLA